MDTFFENNPMYRFISEMSSMERIFFLILKHYNRQILINILDNDIYTIIIKWPISK